MTDPCKIRTCAVILLVACHLLSLYKWADLKSLSGLTRMDEKNIQSPIPHTFTLNDSAYFLDLAAYLHQDGAALLSPGVSPVNLSIVLAQWGIETHILRDASEGRPLALVGILRTPRGSGQQAVVVGADMTASPASGLLLATLLRGTAADLGLLNPLLAQAGPVRGRASWLSKDLVAVFSYAGLAGSAAAADFLMAPQPPDGSTPEGSGRGSRPNGPGIVAVFGLEGLGGGRAESRRVLVMPEGVRGHQPNLDWVALLNNLAAWQDRTLGHMPHLARPSEGPTSSHPRLPPVSSRHPYPPVLGLPFTPGLVCRAFPEPVDASPAEQLAYSWYMGLSLPRGLHSAFTRAQPCDAVGFSVGQPRPWGHPFALVRGPDGPPIPAAPLEGCAAAYGAGQLLQDLLRHTSNLDEHLHHSQAQYLMPGPVAYVDFGESLSPLMPALGLLAGCLGLLWLVQGPPDQTRAALRGALDRHARRLLAAALISLGPWAVHRSLGGWSSGGGVPLLRAPLERCPLVVGLLLGALGAALGVHLAGRLGAWLVGTLVDPLIGPRKSRPDELSFSHPTPIPIPSPPSAPFTVLALCRQAAGLPAQGWLSPASPAAWAGCTLCALHGLVATLLLGLLNPAAAHLLAVLVALPAPLAMLALAPHAPRALWGRLLALLCLSATSLVPPALWGLLAAGCQQAGSLLGCLEALLRLALEWGCPAWPWAVWVMGPLAGLAWEILRPPPAPR
ncbi:hypothetical protein PAPYR_6139 [Paratrimastix pyriformis]|uniref:GPI transamidase component PIG-T n=1 Tax=Paratrimastix pyriformis TaxID=342808 RepID=A0ABQ8ULI0_9EUKA|nr:hypothetical protein PAPYR_6139 [Paratrimastix pyriformis]